jgi:hypothetical protein
MPKEIVLMPYRIIPCDFGHQINANIFRDIVKYLDESQECSILSKSKSANETELLSAKLHLKGNNLNLYLHVYSDGIAIFTLIDKEEVHRYHEYDPERTLEIRKKAHEELLTHAHKVSELMDKHISKIRTFFNKDISRSTSFSTWENKGLSYVMSFYFIKADIKLMEEIDLQEKLTFLLFPYYGESEFDYSPEVDIKSDFVKKQFRENFLSVVEKDYEMLPHIHTCASWSNFLIIGKVTDKVKNDYWKLERELQHVWFYSYITDKFIEESLKNISTKTPEKELENIDNILTEMIFKINQYKGIISSTTHERDFKLYEALRRSSRLDMLVDSVEKKAKLLKDRYNWLLTEKRTETDKKIQFILFIIAIISVIGAYKNFQELGLYTILIILLTILIVIYFFKPFFSIRRKKR